MKTKVLLGLIALFAFVLRFYQLGNNPPSLYWDEASLGYNAFSISQTLRDEHGVFLPVSNFAAFGDYKPVGYIYAIVPFIKLFGLNEIAVRLPSVLAGTFLVLVTYYLVIELINKKRVALLAALFVAISPWSLQMSRAAFEANLATFFTALGVLLFLRKNLLSAVFFVLAMYTFNSHRVFVPLLVVILSLVYFQKKLIIFWLIFLFLLLPLIPHILSPEGRLRFNEVTWLNDLSLVEESNNAIASNNNSWWSKIIFNRRVFYAREFTYHYLDHFRPDFLFLNGDVNPRLSVRSWGEMYWLDLPLIIFGAIYLLKKRDKSSLVIISWLILAPIPAAVARETPHALRELNVLPMPMLLNALGLCYLPKLVRFIAISVFVILVLLYLRDYYLVYPEKYSGDWQYGYKQMVKYVAGIQDKYKFVQVTNHYGRPYIYFLFYNQYQPEKYWNNRVALKDQFGFWTIKSFDKYIFDDSSPAKGRVLFVKATSGPASDLKLIKSLDSFNIYE